MAQQSVKENVVSEAAIRNLAEAFDQRRAHLSGERLSDREYRNFVAPRARRRPVRTEEA